MRPEDVLFPPPNNLRDSRRGDHFVRVAQYFASIPPATFISTRWDGADGKIHGLRSSLVTLAEELAPRATLEDQVIQAARALIAGAGAIKNVTDPANPIVQGWAVKLELHAGLASAIANLDRQIERITKAVEGGGG